jgi:diaminopropionate ammonia-lyase
MKKAAPERHEAGQLARLNCGTPSRVALPVLADAVDLFVAIDDELAREGMRALARADVVGGECSGGGVGALLAPGVLEHLGLGADASALVFLTEGATDPAGYRAVVQVK